MATLKTHGDASLGKITAPAATDIFYLVRSPYNTTSLDGYIEWGDLEADLDHDALQNFVADEHVAHAGVTMTAGAGLKGGGTIAATRTFDSNIVVNAQTIGYTALTTDRGKIIRYTGAGGATLAFTAAATLTDGWYCFVRNDSSGVITLDPNGAETINESATVALAAGIGVGVFCDGTDFYTVGSINAAGPDNDAIHDNVAAEISAITEKVSPVDGDYLLIEDSAAGDAKKFITIGNLPGGADAAAIHDNVANEITAITEKLHRVGNDEIIIEDSEAAFVKKSLKVQSLLSGRPIYNAKTDGALNANWTDEQTPGTTDQAIAEAWIEGGISSGKRRFYFPEGHYRWNPGTISIENANDVEIFGDGIGRTVLHVPGWININSDYDFFKFGDSNDPCWRPHFHDIEIQVGWHCGQQFTDGSVTGWRIYPQTWAASKDVEDGQALISTDGLWIIRYKGDGKTAGSEPTWGAGSPTTENGITITVKAKQTRAISTAYALGDFYQFTGGEIVYVSGAGTSSANADESIPGVSFIEGGEFDFTGVSMGKSSNFPVVENCRFYNFIGFSDAGGKGMTFGTVVFGDEDDLGFKVGRQYGMVRNCRFEEFQYGTGIVANTAACWYVDNFFHRLGGSRTLVGGFNAHAIYGQQGAAIIRGCRFVEQYDGHCVKKHINVANRDGIDTQITNCEFRDFGGNAIEATASGVSTTNPDFDTGAYLEDLNRAITVTNCHFRATKSVNIGTGTAIVDQNGVTGMSIVGCSFFDCLAFQSNTPVDVPYFDLNRSGIQFIGNVISASWRSVTAITNGVGQFIGNLIDLRGEARLTTVPVVSVREYAQFKDNVVWVTGHGNTDGNGIIDIYGNHTKVEGNFIGVLDAADVVFNIQGDGANVRIRNNHIEAGTARVMRLNRTGTSNFLVEGNHVEGTPAEIYLRGIGGDGWIFRNNSGDFFGTGRAETVRSGNAITPVTTVQRIGATATVAYLVDRNGARASAAAAITGIGVYDTDWNTGLGFFSVIELADTGTEHWINASEQVTLGDYLQLSATAGAVRPNGTSGATTKPTSGFVGIVTDAGTASAGAGICKVETIVRNLILPAAGALVFADTSDPGPTDDSNAGYEVGSVGVNTSTGDTFIAWVVTPGAAVWQAT